VNPESISRRVHARCAALVPAGSDVVVGLSGGLDSVVLMNVLQVLAPTLGVRVRALHVHHGLSPRADAWAGFCEELCSDLGVPMRVQRVRVADRSVLGLEAAARAARYRCYLDSGADYVALAHHADDQAETVLLQLLRGAGPSGLAAMPEVRATHGGPRILRPLLGVSRAELRAHCAAANLRWVDDDSNDDTTHARNFLRHEILPRLEVRFPGLRGTFARVAANAADAMFLSDALGGEDLARIETPDGLDLDRLAALGSVRAANAMRVWMARARVAAPPRDRLLDWLGKFAPTVRHRRVIVPGSSLALVANRRCLRLEHIAAAPPGWTVPWFGEASVALPDGRTMRFDACIGAGLRLTSIAGRQAHITTRSGGERLQLAPNRPRRTLKDLLREAGLPPWKRDLVPLVYVEGRLAWVCGVGGDAAFCAAPDDEGLVPTTMDVAQRT